MQSGLDANSMSLKTWNALRIRNTLTQYKDPEKSEVFPWNQMLALMPLAPGRAHPKCGMPAQGGLQRQAPGFHPDTS